MDFLAARPPRCTLVNLVTDERFECLFNPEVLSERISISYRRLSIPGLGFQPLQYDSTSNRQVPGLELILDRRFSGIDPIHPDVLAFRDFIRKLTKPSDPDVPSAPPRVLIIWPKVISIECVITEVEFRYQTFAAEGDVLVYTATCSFEEVIDVLSPLERST